MGFIILKFALSAAIIVAVSEVAKRSGLFGAFIAALPTVSLLSICWLYLETRDAGKVSELSTSIFWLVLPTLPLFLALPWLLRKGYQFPVSLLLSASISLLCYGLVLLAMKAGLIKAVS